MTKECNECSEDTKLEIEVPVSNKKPNEIDYEIHRDNKMFRVHIMSYDERTSTLAARVELMADHALKEEKKKKKDPNYN
jgi:RNase H-fold protein (predicted Holliday junction resolvase)